MKTINFKGHDIEVTPILFTFAYETTVQHGTLIHDKTDEFSDGDIIYGVSADTIQDADDLSQLLEDTGCTVFTRNAGGIYHVEP